MSVSELERGREFGNNETETAHRLLHIVLVNAVSVSVMTLLGPDI